MSSPVSFFNFRGLSSITVALCVGLAVQSGCPSYAASGVTPTDLKKKLVTITPVTASEQQPDGLTVLNSSLAKVKSLNDYSVESGLVTYQKKKDTIEVGRYYFKKPNMIRVEVVKAGAKSGSILVRQGDGAIKARPGKMLKFAKLNLSPDSDMLKAANGYSLLESDFETLLSNVVKDLANPQRKCLVTTKVLVSPIATENVRVVEVFGTDGQVEQRIAVSETSKLPVEWTIVKGGNLFSTSVWKNSKVNSGLSDSLFTLAKKS